MFIISNQIIIINRMSINYKMNNEKLDTKRKQKWKWQKYKYTMKMKMKKLEIMTVHLTSKYKTPQECDV